MKKRSYVGLTEAYLRSVFEAKEPIDRAFYEKNVWWWDTIEKNEFIGSGNADDGMSFGELEMYRETIFRYEFTARLKGEYPHGKPWPWIDFNFKYGIVEATGEIDHEVFDYRDFVAGEKHHADNPPRNGWSHHIGFWFKLDAPKKVIIKEIERLLDEKRSAFGVTPKKPGRPKDPSPWHILKLMDQIENPNSRGTDYDGDVNSDITRLLNRMGA